MQVQRTGYPTPCSGRASEPAGTASPLLPVPHPLQLHLYKQPQIINSHRRSLPGSPFPPPGTSSLFHRRPDPPPDCLCVVASLQAAVLALAPAAMVSRRVTQRARDIFIREINAGGLVLLNEASHPHHIAPHISRPSGICFVLGFRTLFFCSSFFVGWSSFLS